MPSIDALIMSSNIVTGKINVVEYIVVLSLLPASESLDDKLLNTVFVRLQVNDFRCVCPPGRTGRSCEVLLVQLASPTAICLYNERSHSVGDAWSEPKQCSTCRCLDGGQILCERQLCDTDECDLGQPDSSCSVSLTALYKILDVVHFSDQLYFSFAITYNSHNVRNRFFARKNHS